MQVITKNPIIINGIYEDYLNLDGSSSKEEILTAQKIINQLINVENTGKSASQQLKLIKEDGIWRNETATAYADRKSKVDAELDKVKQMLNAFAKGTVSGGFSKSISDISKIETTEQQSWWKKRSKNEKIMIVSAIVLLIGVVGYTIYKNKK